MENIIIIGAGFGGLYTTLYLKKYLKNKKIILFNKYNYFLFTPLLHEVATGGQNRHNIVLEIRELVNGKNCEFYATEVQKIDFNKKEIYFDNTKTMYDKLIIALGSKANITDVKGARQYALPLKTIRDAIAIRTKIVRSLEKASVTKNQHEKEKLLCFAIMGGGPTGVELAGELSEFIHELLPYYPKINPLLVKIYIIQRGPKIIPQLLHDKCIALATKQLRKKNVHVLLNSEVTEVREDYIIINNTTKINAYNIFWTAGIIPRTIETIPQITNKEGYYEVNEFLEVKNLKDVYALGDCALNYNPGSKKPNPALAQLAVKQAKHLASNLYREQNNRKKIPFIFKPEGFLVSVGSWWAIAEIKNKVLKGKFAWWLWRTIYLTKIIGIKNKVRIGIEWFILLFSKRDASEI